MAEKNKIQEFFRKLNVGDEGFDKKKKCDLGGSNVDKSSTTNLIKHLKVRHQKEFAVFELLGKQKNNAAIKGPLRSGNAQKLKQQKLNLTSDSLLQDCADLVTVHGRPLSIFKDKAMLNILSKVNVHHKIYPDKVRDFIQKKADEKKAQVVKFLKDKLPSLEFDFAENMGRSFLGIIAHLYADEKPQTIVLDCKKFSRDKTDS